MLPVGRIRSLQPALNAYADCFFSLNVIVFTARGNAKTRRSGNSQKNHEGV